MIEFTSEAAHARQASKKLPPYLVTVTSGAGHTVFYTPEGELYEKQYGPYGGNGSRNLGIVSKLVYRNAIKTAVKRAWKSYEIK